MPRSRRDNPALLCVLLCCCVATPVPFGCRRAAPVLDISVDHRRCTGACAYRYQVLLQRRVNGVLCTFFEQTASAPTFESPLIREAVGDEVVVAVVGTCDAEDASVGSSCVRCFGRSTVDPHEDTQTSITLEPVTDCQAPGIASCDTARVPDSGVDGSDGAAQDAADRDAQRPASLAEGLVAWYELEDDPQDGLDPGPGTDEAASCPVAERCPILVEGRFGGGYSFDGERGFRIAEDGDLVVEDAFSVAFWIKIDGFSGTIVSKHGAYSIGIDSDRVHFSTSVEGSWHTTAATGLSLIDGRWYQLTVTSDGVRKTVYINGFSVQSDASAQEAYPQIRPVFVGWAGTAVPAMPRGSAVLDDLRIYNRALSEREVSLLANR